MSVRSVGGQNDLTAVIQLSVCMFHPCHFAASDGVCWHEGTHLDHAAHAAACTTSALVEPTSMISIWGDQMLDGLERGFGRSHRHSHQHDVSACHGEQGGGALHR